MRAPTWLWVVGVGVLLGLAAPARAQLAEPSAPADPQPLLIPRPVSQQEINDTNNTVNGVPNAGNFVSLPSLFKFRNEAIDYQKDAKTEPSTFSPLCSFSGTLVLRGGGCRITFGWYNAVQSGGPPPAATEIYPLIPSTDPAVYGGTAFTPLAATGPWVLKTFTADDIRNDPRYKKGEIGFALVGGDQCSQTKYSQRALNQVCTSCTPNTPFITTIVYKSTVAPDAYYMAFEDLPVSPTSFTANNDGDFNDFVFFITGLICSGGGEPCDTGLTGACALGKTDCSVDGKPGECRQVVKPTDEACDNVDNDCNGMVDDGDLCPKGKVCDHGSCVAACGTGEFRCPGGFDCDRGFCIDPLCVGKVCEAGKACRAGDCIGACDGATCPHGQECQLGHCVDLCAGVTCLDKQVCEKGLCLADCGCRDCGTGRTCAADGRCVDTGCETQTCLAGQVCEAGACIDACNGAVCPGKAACVDGKCQSPVADDNTMTTGGTGGSDPGIVISSAGSLTLPPPGGAAASGGTASVIPGKNNGAPVLKSGAGAAGCSCRIGAEQSSSRLALFGLGALALAALRRRKR
jgi:MYXO-CTERM domain-containing protein